MAYGYPYQMQQPVMPSYFNTNYAPPMPQMQQQTPAANVTWIYVNGWDGARNQIVQPGQTAWMMDNNDPVIYIIVKFSHIVKTKNQRKLDFSIDKPQYLRYNTTMVKEIRQNGGDKNVG